MNDDRKLVLAQKKARLKEEQKRAEISVYIHYNHTISFCQESPVVLLVRKP